MVYKADRKIPALTNNQLNTVNQVNSASSSDSQTESVLKQKKRKIFTIHKEKSITLHFSL